MPLEKPLEKKPTSLAIETLDGDAITELVRDVGLEDAGEIAALASPAQLARVFDHDLWRASARGGEEKFDDARFGLWLEVLLEMGAESAAARILEIDALDDGVVALGLARIFSVFATDALALSVRDDDEDGDRIEKLLTSSDVTEIEGFLLVARTSNHVDAALAIVAELDRVERGALERILARIAGVTAQSVDDRGGLFAFLSSDDELEAGVAGARLDRREEQGFVSPADAAAYLRLAQAGAGNNAISRAYLGANASRPAELAFLAGVFVAHDELAAVDAANRALAVVKRGMASVLPSGGADAVSLLVAFAAGLSRR